MAAELAVVVIGLGAPASLVAAVRSLLAQRPLPEILVVNSGGGGAAELLRRAGLGSVPVLERPERLFAGAARNLGITATRAPLVAFLASDCQALPDWASERLRLHALGHAAVASAVIHDRPGSLVGWAYHLVLHAGRLPGLPAGMALRYGASFTRALLEESGGFDPELRAGEDVAFLRALPGPQPLWAPSVVTLHPAGGGILRHRREFRQRGYREGIWRRRLFGEGPEAAPPHVEGQVRWARDCAVAALSGEERRLALRALPLVRHYFACMARGRRAMEHLFPSIDAGTYREPVLPAPATAAASAAQNACSITS